MKKYLISVMFLLIGYILYAQEEEITMVVSKYSNNTIEQVGFLDQNGKKDSTWTIYNESGSIVGVGTYSHGVKEGYWYSYNDNGDKIFEVLYVNGEKRKGKQWNDEGHLIDKRKW
jgi:antitoxin component YwqK of YwqJK toxin-antitoxin module